MQRVFKLKKEDSEDIGFVYLCLLSAAINMNEFKKWLDYVIENSAIDDIPTYFFDLLNIESVGEINRNDGVIPFTISAGLSKGESSALSGIAHKRGNLKNINYDLHITKESALRAVRKNPHVEDRFRETFPFIDY